MTAKNRKLIVKKKGKDQECYEERKTTTGGRDIPSEEAGPNSEKHSSSGRPEDSLPP